MRLGTEATAELVRELAPGRRDRRGGSRAEPHGLLERQPPRREPARKRAGERAHGLGRAARFSGRPANTSSFSTTTGRATRPAWPRCCSTAASDVELVSRWHALFPSTLTTLDMAHIYGRLLSKGLEYRLNSWASAIEGDRVSIFNLYTGQGEVLEDVDTVVLADRREGERRALLRAQGLGREPAPDRRLPRAAEARPCDLRGRACRPRAVVARASATSTRASSSAGRRRRSARRCSGRRAARPGHERARGTRPRRPRFPRRSSATPAAARSRRRRRRRSPAIAATLTPFR